MADNHIPLRLIDLLPFDQPAQGVIIGKIIAVLIHSRDLLYHGRTDKGKQIEIHITIFVCQNSFLYVLFRRPRRQTDHIHILPGEHASEAVDPGTAVMIPADQHDSHIQKSGAQAADKMVKYFNCLRRRDRFVIDIPGNQDRVRPLLNRKFCDLL